MEPLLPHQALELRHYKPRNCSECMFMDKHEFKFNKVNAIKKTRRLAKHLCTLYVRTTRSSYINHYIASYETTKRPPYCPIDHQLKRMVYDTLRQQEVERQREQYMRDGAIAN